MMPNILSERIAALRKERGLTQEQLGKMVGVSYQAVGKWEKGGAPDVELLPILAEQLGVTIDALFGLEGGERVDVAEVVGRWLRGFPEKERMEQFCRLVWTSINLFLPDGLKVPKMEYLPACRPHMDRENKIMYTEIRGGGGLLMDVHAKDMTFVTLWPEPEEGYASFFAPMEDYRRLFAVLAKPGCLELLDSLYWRKSNYFTPPVIAKQCGLPLETVTGLLEELSDIGIFWSMKLELEEGEVKAYKLAEPLTLVPFLMAAQGFMETSCNYMYFYDNEAPLLRGKKWKAQEDNEHEKA